MRRHGHKLFGIKGSLWCGDDIRDSGDEINAGHDARGNASWLWYLSITNTNTLLHREVVRISWWTYPNEISELDKNWTKNRNPSMTQVVKLFQAKKFKHKLNDKFMLKELIFQVTWVETSELSPKTINYTKMGSFLTDPLLCTFSRWQHQLTDLIGSNLTLHLSTTIQRFIWTNTGT